MEAIIVALALVLYAVVFILLCIRRQRLDSKENDKYPKAFKNHSIIYKNKNHGNKGEEKIDNGSEPGKC